MDEVKPPCLSEGYRTTSYLSTSLGLFLNALAIVLILFRTTKELRVYSRVLLGNCVVDVLFIVVTFVVDLHISFRNGIVFYVVDGGLLREETLHTKFVLIVLYLFVLYLTIFVVAPPFIYRYFAVCR
ncbi:hypothetical protein AAVH_11560 [Aphelenchoides avenae]|nr:hypothetical protein AAVH_11560 [Aphelenchus avenae]